MEETILQKLEEIKSLTMLSAKSMLTPEEAAWFIGVSKSHLYKLTSSRMIPHYKPRGKMIYFDKHELEEWMKQGKVKSQDEIEEEAARYVATHPISFDKGKKRNLF